MNLFKFKFDLKGSSNLIQTVTIPSDSKYSVGIKIVDGENEVVLDDTMKITIQDDKFIYTPTEIFNNYAVFACSTGSNVGESKSYQVKFHKDGADPEIINEYDYINDTASTKKANPIKVNCNDFLAALGGDEVEKWDLHNFTVYFDGDDRFVNGQNMGEDFMNGKIPVIIYSDKFGMQGYFNVVSRPGMNVIVPSRVGNKYGWRIWDQTVENTKRGQPLTEEDIITTGKFSDYGIDLVDKYFYLGAVNIPANTTYHQRVEMGEAVPEVNSFFKGFNVKTNDSKVSNWAITDSQMKIVYTDEWPELSSTADDRLIYFVVDKPTPPQPVPPKPVPPTPGGDMFGIEIMSDFFPDVTKDTTYDPTSKEDALRFNDCAHLKRYEINGKVFYLELSLGFSDSAVFEGDYAKTDQVIVGMRWCDGGNMPGYTVNFSGYMLDGNKISYVSLYKQFDSRDERDAYIAEWKKEIYDGEPVIKLDLPDDIDDWQIQDEEEIPQEAIIENNDDYVWIEMEIEDEGESFTLKDKIFKKVSTYPQWIFNGEPG